MVAPNRTEIEGSRGRTKSEHSETSNYSVLPIHRLFVTPLQSVGVLPINFNRRGMWVGLRFPASAHSNGCIPDHSQEGKMKVQVPSNCGDRRDSSLCHRVILNSGAVLWHDVFLPSVKLMLSSWAEGASGREHRTKPSTQTAPRSLFTFPTSHLSQWQIRVCKQRGKTALNEVLPKRQRINSACSVNASQSMWATSGDELPQQNAKTSAMERRPKDCTVCPTLVAFIFLFYPCLHSGTFGCILGLDNFIKGCKHPVRLWARFESLRKEAAYTKHDWWCPKDCHRQSNRKRMQVSFSSLPFCVLCFTGGSAHADKQAALSTKLKDSKICLCSSQGQRRDWKHMLSVFGMIQFR